MVVSDKVIEWLCFGLRLSSGPDSIVYYDQNTNKFYSTLICPHNEGDIEVYRSYSSEIRFDSDKTTFEKVKAAIFEFKSPIEIRDEKIDDILE